MDPKTHHYLTVAYDLYTDNAQGVHELIEKAPEEHPFQFITGLGVALDSFEARVAPLAEGETFDFVLDQQDAYGPYDPSYVVELPKDTFRVNGHFDKHTIYEGARIPLVNADGNRFEGLVVEVKDEAVVIDLNERLAGKNLHFVGKIVTKREATDAEIEALVKMMSGEGGCGCGCDDCGGGCGGHVHHEDCGCCGGGEGHGHCHDHGHEHGQGGCCGGEGHGHCHDHGHEHGQGGCCGGGHCH